MKKQMIRGNIILSIVLACILCVVNVHNDQNIITANSNRFNEGDTTITTETNLVNDDKKNSGITVEEGILEGDDTADNNKDKDKNKDKDNNDKKGTDKDSDKEGCTNCTTTTETTTKDTKTTNRKYDITIKTPKKEETPEKKKEKKKESKKILPKAGEGKLPLLEIAVITTVLGIIYVSNVKSMQKRLQI